MVDRAPAWAARARKLAPYAPLVLATLSIAFIATRNTLRETGGVPAVPLDDSYIHFQYARGFAELRPMVYTAGSLPAPGATSLLWPLVLAPFSALGATGAKLVWFAWAFGWIALGLCAYETYRLALGLLVRELAIAAGAMVLVFGGMVWCAGSGMEVVPFAWLITRAARLSADWFEREERASRSEIAQLIGFATLATLTRPEGVLAVVCAALAIALRPRGRPRALAIAPLVAPAIVPLVNLWATGQAESTTALVKWLPFSPYHRGERLWSAIGGNIELLFGTLLDGRVWAALFVPSGGRVIAWLALPTLVFIAWRNRRGFRGAMALALALGILIPTTYDSFLWNRLRYLWPFSPGWFVALAAIAETVGLVVARFRPELRSVRLLVAGLFVGAFAGQLSPSIDDLSTSSDAIRRQQVALGIWANENLPKDAVLGVNDTGAVAYFSERRVFDVCGLTTRGEARFWSAGAGSRFEHYERTNRADLPTHFVVYPDWLAIPPLLGQRLTERTVSHTILGGTTMVATVADYSTLGSAEEPLAPARGASIDRLDVADLESEAAHAYEIFWGTQGDDTVHEADVEGRARADGGRDRRTLERFSLELRPSGILVARLASEEPLEIRVRVDGHDVGLVAIAGLDAWDEVAVDLPRDLGPGGHKVELVPPAGKSFGALHYWSFPPAGGEASRTPD